MRLQPHRSRQAAYPPNPRSPNVTGVLAIVRSLPLTLAVVLSACAGDRSRSSEAWKVSEATDKLTGDTVTTAVTEQISDDKSLVGRLALECRSPSKKLQLTMSSFEPDGKGVAFDDTIAVRVRNAPPNSIVTVFSGGASALDATLAAMTRADGTGDALSMPATNVIRAQFDVLLANLKARADLSRQVDAAPGKEKSARLARLASLRAIRAARGDNDTTFDHVNRVAFGNYERDEIDKAMKDLGRSTAFTLARDSILQYVKAAKDEAELVMQDTTSEYGGVVDKMNSGAAEFARVHFGDVANIANAAALVRAMGPELVFQYYNKGRSNTLVLKVADVAPVLKSCQ